jgi:hypothetical protein
VFFQLEAVDEAKQRGDHPAQWANDLRRGKLKRLVVENDGSLSKA